MGDNLQEIPKTIKYLDEYCSELTNDFIINLSYSDNTAPTSVAYIKKNYSYDKGDKKPEYRYSISATRIKAKKGELCHRYKISYHNNKNEAYSSGEPEICIKDTGKTTMVDEVLRATLSKVKQLLDPFWD